jgi:hypothetical protein
MTGGQEEENDQEELHVLVASMSPRRGEASYRSKNEMVPEIVK